MRKCLSAVGTPANASPRGRRLLGLLAATSGLAMALSAGSAGAAVFTFNNGSPDQKIGALSQPAFNGGIQTEVADDFTLASQTQLTHATFTGLLSGAQISSIKNVEIEFYHLFGGADSDLTRTAGVPTRVNSPADVEIASATRDGADGSLSFTTDVLNDSFFVNATVTDRVTAGARADDGATGLEVQFNIDFDSPVTLDAGHFFFRPEVELTDGQFLWLSAPKTIPAPTDLQAWMRNDTLAPDWLRIGTDIVGAPAGGGAAPQFNMAFSLEGVAGVPEPATWAMLVGGFAVVGGAIRRRRASDARSAAPCHAA
jgi:hypothetical protein